MRKLLALILALALCLTLVTALVACGDGGDGGTTPPVTDGDGDGDGDEDGDGGENLPPDGTNRVEFYGYSFDVGNMLLVSDNETTKMWYDSETGAYIQASITYDLPTENGVIGEKPTPAEYKAAVEGAMGGTVTLSDVTITGTDSHYILSFTCKNHKGTLSYVTLAANASEVDENGNYTATMITFTEYDPERPLGKSFR